MERRLYFYLLMAAAAAIRIPGIVSAPFWSDEYFSWLTATQPTFVQFFLRCVGVDVYPPLSYFPVWIIAKFSDAQWALRLPSAIAGLLCVWATVRMMRRYVTENRALALGALVALAPLSVYLGWEAKAYNFFALMNLLMLDEGLRVLDEPGRGHRRLALWVAASMWSFFLSPYFIAALLVGAWWQERRASPAFKALWKACWVGMLWALPLAPFFIKTLLLYSGSSAYNTALALAPFFSFENFSAGFWMLPGKQAVAFAAFAAAVALLWIPREATDAPVEPPRLTKMLGAMACLPPLLFLAVSALAKPNYNDRAMLVCAFSWVLLAGLGAMRLKGPLLKLMLAALMLTQATALLDYRGRPEAQRVDYGPAWQLITQQWSDGDLVMHAYFESGLPFNYYAARELKSGWRKELRPTYTHQEDLGFSSAPAAQGIRGAWRRVNAWLGEHGMGVYAGSDPSFVDGERLEAAVKNAKRIWFVVATDEAVRRAMMQVPNGFRGGQQVGRAFDFSRETWMKGKFRYRSQQGDEDVRVYLYDRKA